MQTSNYKILLRQEPEGSYSVFVPSLEGCITFGKDLQEAKTNAKDAIELYIESLKEDNLPVPNDNNLLELSLEVSHA